MSKNEIIKSMMLYLNFDYTTSILLYDFCEKRNEMYLIFRNIERERKIKDESIHE